jgi:hypothetical protein
VGASRISADDFRRAFARGLDAAIRRIDALLLQ